MLYLARIPQLSQRSEVESGGGEDVRLLNFKGPVLQATMIVGKYKGFIKAHRSLPTQRH